MTAAETPHKALDRISDPESYRTRVYEWGGYWSFEVTGSVVPFYEGHGYLSREDARRAAQTFIEGHSLGESLHVAELERRAREDTNG